VRRLVAIGLVSLVCAAGAGAHAPTTAIGRAVVAFDSVPVSYDPGAAVTDLEADRFNLIVDSNPKVAFMPASARDEIAGGPNAIAEEIGREANLDGTLVVLVGTQLGTWSDDIGDDRLAELVREAETPPAETRNAETGEAESGEAKSTAQVVESLVRSIQAEPAGGTPWGWIGVGLATFAIALIAFDRLVRRRAATSR
jgi:hypothetical protein